MTDQDPGSVGSPRIRCPMCTPSTDFFPLSSMCKYMPSPHYPHAYPTEPSAHHSPAAATSQEILRILLCAKANDAHSGALLCSPAPSPPCCRCRCCRCFCCFTGDPTHSCLRQGQRAGAGHLWDQCPGGLRQVRAQGQHRHPAGSGGKVCGGFQVRGWGWLGRQGMR